MTWEEMGRRYDREKQRIPLFEREPKLEKDWGRLVRSTEKLVWLFALSSGGNQLSRSCSGPYRPA
jgi:hypothetical protein